MKKKLLVVRAFRDIAIIAFIEMFVHVMLLLTGYEFEFVWWTFYLPLPVGVMAISLSELMHYCRLHQYCLGYAMLVSFGMNRTAFGNGFGDAVTVIRLIVLVIGIFILCGVIRKVSNKEIWIRNRKESSDTSRT